MVEHNVTLESVVGQSPKNREVVVSAALPSRFFRGSNRFSLTPKNNDALGDAPKSTPSLEFVKAGLRGEASIHVMLIDSGLLLDACRLRKLASLAAELANRLDEAA